MLSTDNAHRCFQCLPGTRTPSDKCVCSASRLTTSSEGSPVTRPVPLRGGTAVRLAHQVTAEVLAHQADHLVVVDVARDRHHHPFRGVAADVERMQLRSRHPGNRSRAADHGTPDRMLAEDRRQEDIAERVLRVVVAHGDLLEHHGALELDVVGRARPRNTTSATRSTARSRSVSSTCA